MTGTPRVLRTRLDLQNWSREQRAANRLVGFVPTLGALHAGHGRLIQQARRDNDLVLVSVFVNPKQFGDAQDFSLYPRNEVEDLQLAGRWGADAVFIPGVEEVFPQGFDVSLKLDTESLSPFEARSRPGHFEGVCLVVLVLLNLSGASRAYFGQKDHEQVVMLKSFLLNIAHPCEMVIVPTQREADGLAMSSRNRHLDPVTRSRVVSLPRSLALAGQEYLRGCADPSVLLNLVRSHLEDREFGVVEYLSCVKRYTLQESRDTAEESVLLVAWRVQALGSQEGQPGPTVRLLDNLVLSREPDWETEIKWLISASDLSDAATGHT